MDNKDILSIRIENVDQSEVPVLIQSQFTMMSELRKEIESASDHALDAKETVINEVGSRSISRKGAIENLQSATLNLANAQVDAMNAQKLSFEYQQKLSEITKFLFRLGLSNIAMNRVVVEELEYKLRNSSQGEIDELARREIENLLKRLKMQQDIDQKQSELTKLVKEQYDTNEKQESIIAAQAEKDEEHDRRIDELYAALVKQDEIIERILLEMDEMRKDLFQRDDDISNLKAEIEHLKNLSC